MKNLLFIIMVNVSVSCLLGMEENQTSNPPSIELKQRKKMTTDKICLQQFLLYNKALFWEQFQLSALQFQSNAFKELHEEKNYNHLDPNSVLAKACNGLKDDEVQVLKRKGKTDVEIDTFDCRFFNHFIGTVKKFGMPEYVHLMSIYVDAKPKVTPQFLCNAGRMTFHEHRTKQWATEHFDALLDENIIGHDTKSDIDENLEKQLKKESETFTSIYEKAQEQQDKIRFDEWQKEQTREEMKEWAKEILKNLIH